MIARIWYGRTKAKDFDDYTKFMKEKAVPDYQSTPGFVKLSFLRRLVEEEAHFTLITYWENLEVIKNFAGEDYEKAKYYPEDNDYLLEFEEKVVHHDVFAELS
ncbi:antibiotic biosynthesis monooxygenase [Ekhidna sp.]|uniref:antibiotic biosynthesis monooxygenase n=1 Tax=Ekhidna sp. TaxID=2608089 RepID=UPI003C7BBD64